MYTFSDWEDIKDDVHSQMDNSTVEETSVSEAVQLFKLAAKQVKTACRKLAKSHPDSVPAEGAQLLELVSFRLVQVVGFHSLGGDFSGATKEVVPSAEQLITEHKLGEEHIELFREAIADYREHM